MEAAGHGVGGPDSKEAGLVSGKTVPFRCSLLWETSRSIKAIMAMKEG